jgi:hypothetical protein
MVLVSGGRIGGFVDGGMFGWVCGRRMGLGFGGVGGRIRRRWCDFYMVW